MSDKQSINSSVLSLSEKIYDDMAHPVLSQLGKLIALPVVFLGYPAEILLEKYKTVIKKAVEKVPPDKQTKAKPHIAAPIIEYMKYVFDDEKLLEAFTNLLATCIDTDYSKLIHPSFFEKVKQLSSFDLKVLTFINSQIMFCYSELIVEVLFNEMNGGIMPYLYLFSNMQDFNNDSQQVDKSITLLISLGVLDVANREYYSPKDYADRLAAFRDTGYEIIHESDLLNDYIKVCYRNYDDEIDDYEGALYSHDRFFFGIELSPELEQMILDEFNNKSNLKINAIACTRKTIRLTSYGEHFKQAVFRNDNYAK